VTGMSVPPKAPIFSRARADGLLLRIPCNHLKLATEIARLGPLRLKRDSRSPRGLHAVHLELWKIRDGAVQIGELHQHEWFERWGGLRGAALGSSARWKSFLGAMSRASIRAFDTYSELVLTVPGVIVKGDDRCLPRSLVLGMMTDSPIARWADATLGFGYQKTPGRFRHDAAGVWSVSTPNGRRLLSVVSLAVPADDGLVTANLEAIFQQPFVGVSDRHELRESRVYRTLSQSDARFRPIAASVELVGDCFASLFAESHELPPYANDSPWGALQFWNLEAVVSYPYPL
jgi:hypothetical protein